MVSSRRDTPTHEPELCLAVELEPCSDTSSPRFIGCSSVSEEPEFVAELFEHSPPLLLHSPPPRNVWMPFCHVGVGHTFTGFPPTSSFPFFDFPLEGEVTLRTGASCFLGALATTAVKETTVRRYSNKSKTNTKLLVVVIYLFSQQRCWLLFWPFCNTSEYRDTLEKSFATEIKMTFTPFSCTKRARQKVRFAGTTHALIVTLDLWVRKKMATEAIISGIVTLQDSEKCKFPLKLRYSITDVGIIYKRLLNHRPVIQNEVHYFVKEFEVSRSQPLQL